jgi:dolichol-phosphate mannosyltransferase
VTTPVRLDAGPVRSGLVIVPTYNERENVARIIETTLEQDPRLSILIVDDGSPDGTGAIVDVIAATNDRVHVLHRAKKMGLGTAYLAGFKWALSRDFECVFEMDADFSHDPGHLPEFLRAIETTDLVLGSRYRNGKVTVVNWPISRLILSYAANIYARSVTGLQLYDATGGFKCFRRRVLETIDLDDVRSNGYAFEPGRRVSGSRKFRSSSPIAPRARARCPSTSSAKRSGWCGDCAGGLSPGVYDRTRRQGLLEDVRVRERLRVLRCAVSGERTRPARDIG